MKPRMLPRKSKFFGIALILLCWVPLLLFKKIGWLPKNEELGLNILRGVMLLGLLLIIISKEKIEDEFIDSCRLIAFRISFIFGIGVYITGAFIFGEGKNGFEVLIGEIIFYLFVFYSLKSGLIKYDK